MIYFASDGEFIKIGFSRAPVRRFASLKAASPRPLQLLGLIEGDRTREQELHRRFTDQHHRGEWFRAEPMFVREIQELLQQCGVISQETKPANLHARVQSRELEAFREASQEAGMSLTAWVRWALRQEAGPPP